MAADRIPVALRAAAIKRTFAGAFAALRELEREDPTEAASIRAAVAGEVGEWIRRDAVPLEVSRG